MNFIFYFWFILEEIILDFLGIFFAGCCFNAIFLKLSNCLGNCRFCLPRYFNCVHLIILQHFYFFAPAKLVFLNWLKCFFLVLFLSSIGCDKVTFMHLTPYFQNPPIVWHENCHIFSKTASHANKSFTKNLRQLVIRQNSLPSWKVIHTLSLILRAIL